MGKPRRQSSKEPLRNGDGNGSNQPGRTGMMHASPMAYIGVVIAIIGLATQIGTIGYIYAKVVGDIETCSREVARNFKEDGEQRERSAKSIERIDTTIGGLAKLHIDMEVMKTNLGAINETLKRMEVRFDKRIP